MTRRVPAPVALKPLLSPAFYRAHAIALGEMVTKEYIKPGLLAQPITGLMVTIGTVGYLMEYWTLGRASPASRNALAARAPPPRSDVAPQGTTSHTTRRRRPPL